MRLIPIPSLRVLLYSKQLACNNLCLPPLYYRRRGDMILASQLLYGMLSVDTCALFTFCQLQINYKGHNFKLCKPRARTNLRLNSFSNWVINNWNNLLAYVVNTHSLSCFKNLLDIHFTDSHYECSFMFYSQAVSFPCNFKLRNTK